MNTETGLPTIQNEGDPFKSEVQIEMVSPSNQSQMRSSKVFERYQSKMGNSGVFSKIENVNKIKINLQAQSINPLYIPSLLIENVYKVEDYHKKQQLDYTKFKAKIDSMHMRKSNPKTLANDIEYSCCRDVVCGTSIPGHCCWSTSKSTAVDSRGVGVTLYFKGLKHLIWNYLFFSIMSIPVIFFCVYSSKNNSMEIDDFQSALQSTTVGNIGLDARKCQKDLFTSQTDSYLMKCSTGNFAMKETFQWGLIMKSKSKQDFEEQNCSFVDLTRMDKSKNKDKKSIKKIEDCQNKSECEFTKADIQSLFDITNYDDVQFFFTSYCQGTYYTFPYDFKLEKKYVAYIVAGIDAFIVLWYVIMVYSQGSAEEESITNILKDKRTPSHFTVQITNLPKNIKSEEHLISDLQSHIERSVHKFAQRDGYQTHIKVIDVKISESQKEIVEQRKKGVAYKENLKRVYLFLETYDKDKQIVGHRKRVTINNLQQLRDTIKDESLRKKATKDLEVIEKAYVNIGKAVEKITKIEDNSEIKYAWVTFDNIQMKQIAEDKLSSSAWERFLSTICGCCSCCVPQDKIFQKKFLEVGPSPNPDSILWENNDAKGQWIRKLISFIITVAVLVGSYILIVWIRNAKQDIQQRYPAVDCKLPTFDDILEPSGEEKVVQEYNQYSNISKVGYIQCFCKKNINDIFNGSLDDPYKQICTEWLKDYSLSQFLPYAAVICIIIINMILQVLFTLLSQFEKYKLLDDELKSRILKTFVAQFINTGLILLLTNINFDVTTDTGLSFLFGGNYTDLSPQWFKNVGTVIILTLLINVISAPMISMIFTAIRNISRWCDRGCSGDQKVTKKKTLQEWVDFYTGPEFLISFRYSQILGICFIGMLYSGGIPVLYFTSFLHLSVLYWIDKIYLFKVNKLPLNYDEQMAQMVRRLLYLVPFLHTIFSIYIYGNTDIFFEIQYIEKGMFDISSSNAIVQKFIERVLQRQQNIAHGIILAILLLLFIIKYILLKPLSLLTNMCLAKTGMNKYLEKTKKHQNFYQDSYLKFLSKDQLNEETGLLEYYNMEHSEKPQEKQAPLFAQYLNRKKIDCQNTLMSKQFEVNNSNIIGMFSYDIRHNPMYKKLYDWDKKIAQ